MNKLRKFRNRALMLSLAGAAAFAVTACGNGGGGGATTGGKDADAAAKNSAIVTKPVTIKFSRTDNYIMEPIDNAIKETLGKKYPNITLEIVQQTKGNSIEEQVAAGTPSDIYQGGSGTVNTLKPLGLNFDLTPLIKSHNFDIGRIEPHMLDLMRLKSDDGKALLGLPYANGFNLMFYNKDIFDKFGVPYPKDGMTWEQIMDLSKKVTRQDGGTQYYGFAIGGNWYTPFQAQFGLPLVDVKTSKAAVTTEGWKRAFDYAKRLYEAGGNDPKLYSSSGNMFYKDKVLAMWISNNNSRYMSEMNWDMVSLPSTPEKPGIGGPSPYNVMTIASSSKEKDAAFQVLDVIFTDEVQTAIAKYGMPSPLKDDKYKKMLGQDAGMNGKNVMAVFNNKPAPLLDDTDLDPYVNKALAPVMKDVLAGKKDINTALREAADTGNANIEAAGVK
ncbi:MAG: transporter substrate-binding protein [Paenibacillaceae bacterium]|nr:transporter substrate-binding protein [Paenibacillaceae bacterium]